MELFFQMLKQTVVTYFKEKLADKVKAACLKGLEAFKDCVWKEIKEEVKQAAAEGIAQIEAYCNSAEGKAKEEEIVNFIMDKIKLPLIAKPFKGLIKKMLKEKINNLVREVIEKTKGAVGI